MTSSEIVESGRGLVGQKSTFAQTCSLLSQYMKEKRSLGDFSLGLSRGFDSGAPAKTMDLLPMLEKNSPPAFSVTEISTAPVDQFSHQAGLFGPGFPVNNADKSVARSEPVTTPMTIFYGGEMMVFNDIPMEKAREILFLAKGNTAAGTNSGNMVSKPTETAVVANLGETAQPNVHDLPIARKASLTRFLEKRKDRITSKAPYPVGIAAGESQKAAAAPWMGFGTQFPVQMGRHSYHHQGC